MSMLSPRGMDFLGEMRHKDLTLTIAAFVVFVLSGCGSNLQGATPTISAINEIINEPMVQAKWEEGKKESLNETLSDSESGVSGKTLDEGTFKHVTPVSTQMNAELTVVASESSFNTPTPAPSVTPVPTLTLPITHIPTVLPTPTVSPTSTVLPTLTVSPTPTVLPTPTVSPTPTVLPTPTVSPIPTVLPTPTVSPTPTVLPTPTVSPTPTVLPTSTVSPTPTSTLAPTPATPSPTATITPTLVSYRLKTFLNTVGTGDIHPNGINYFPAGAEVLVSANCYIGFKQWSGNDLNLDVIKNDPITITMNMDRVLEATCEPTETPTPTITPTPVTYRLLTIINTEGTGYVYPDGINYYAVGTEVMVSANCYSGFIQWSGSGLTVDRIKENPIIIVIDKERMLEATCNPIDNP